MDDFENDETRPVRRSPSQSASASSTKQGATNEALSGPPAFDPFNDDVTIMVDREPTVGRGRVAAFDSAPTVGRDALARKTNEVLSRNSPDSSSPLADRWTPPARPNAPGVEALRTRKEISIVLPIIAAVLISAGLFVFLFLRLRGEG